MADKDTTKVVTTVLHDVILDQTQQNIRENMSESVKIDPIKDPVIPTTKAAEKKKIRGNLRII